MHSSARGAFVNDPLSTGLHIICSDSSAATAAAVPLSDSLFKFRLGTPVEKCDPRTSIYHGGRRTANGAARRAWQCRCVHRAGSVESGGSAWPHGHERHVLCVPRGPWQRCSALRKVSRFSSKMSQQYLFYTQKCPKGTSFIVTSALKVPFLQSTVPQKCS